MKTILTTILVLASCLTAGATTIKVGRHIAVLDSLTDVYLCPISKVHFGQDYTATVEADSTVTDLSIDGNDISSDSLSQFTFSNVTGGKMWEIKFTRNNERECYMLTFTYLPLLLLNGTFGNDYTLGTIQLLDPDNYSDEVMSSRVKWRGGTTNLGDKHKRNYHLKLVDENGDKMERKFLGLRKDNSWIMDAGQIDFLRVRNRVGTELWNSFASLPYYSDREPKVKTGVDGGMVETFLNGRYTGVYALTEAMDRKTLKLAKYDETTDEIHGQLWKASELNNTTAFNHFLPYDNTQETWSGFETKYPELDEVFPTNYKPLADAVYLADTASIADFNRKGHLTFDLPIIIDYEIMLQVMLGVDNYGKNIYWYTYDSTESDKLSLALWDIDTSVGGNWNAGVVHPDNLIPTRAVSFPNGIFKKITRYSSRYWRQGIQRYQQLRQGPLATQAIIDRYVNAVENLDGCGAISREERRWSRDTDLVRHELNIKKELEYVVDWIEKRMDFLDNTRYRTPVHGDANGDYLVDINDISVVNDAILSSEGWFYNASADINGNETVDVSDINELINILLNTNQEQ